MMRWTAALVVATLPAIVQAQPSPPTRCPEFERQMRTGLDLRRQEHHEAALVMFRAMAERCPSPQLTAQIALAEHALGRWTDAWTHVREALDAAADPWIAARRASLETVRDEIAAHLARVQVTTATAGAALWVDGARAASLPMASPAWVAAGARTLEVRAANHRPWSRAVTLAPGESFTEPVVLADVVAEAPPPPPPPPPPPLHHEELTTPPLRYVGYGAVGVGAALAIVGVVQWVRSSLQSSEASEASVLSPDALGAWARYQDQVNAPATTGGARPRSADDVCASAEHDAAMSSDASSARDLCATNRTTRLTAIAFTAGGLALAGFGAAALLFARPAHRDYVLQVAPMVGRHSGGAVFRLTF